MINDYVPDYTSGKICDLLWSQNNPRERILAPRGSSMVLSSEIEEVNKEIEAFSFSPNLKHLLPFFQSSNDIIDQLNQTQRKKVKEICDLLPEYFYVSKENAPVLLTLLRNVVICFDKEGSFEGNRYRRCNVILGLKNTGKTTLVSQLKIAIEKSYPSCVALFVDGGSLFQRETSIDNLLRAACKRKRDKLDSIPAMDGSIPPGLENLLEALHSQGVSPLIIIDEAQKLYPFDNKNDELNRHNITKTESFIVELCSIAEQTGCVGWLTGSSQALRSLYTKGEHPDYLGKFNDLNNKKFIGLNYFGLHDIESIQELFKCLGKEPLSDTDATDFYKVYGGAIGDLLKKETLQDNMIENWGEEAWSVLKKFAERQSPTNKTFPRNLKAIARSDLISVIRAVQRDFNIRDKTDILIQKLCDQYVIERDRDGNYRIAYPWVLEKFTELYQQYHNDFESSQRYIAARVSLNNDHIPNFLQVVLEAMFNIPFHANSTIRKKEAYPHSIIHVFLWLCHPSGSQFDSGANHQEGELDIVFVNKYRHYIELKNEDSLHTAEDALGQIFQKKYEHAFPRAHDASSEAFYYGVKWTNKSNSITIECDANEEGKRTELWNLIKNVKEIK